MASRGLFYVGFFAFFFVFGGIVGNKVFPDIQYIFYIAGLCVSIVGVFMGRFIVTLMGF